jgi:hypothetical protein
MAILDCTLEATDYRDRRVKWPLLQIAALAGDVNMQAKNKYEHDHGMVERLKQYASKKNN